MSEEKNGFEYLMGERYFRRLDDKEQKGAFLSCLSRSGDIAIGSDGYTRTVGRDLPANDLEYFYKVMGEGDLLRYLLHVSDDKGRTVEHKFIFCKCQSFHHMLKYIYLHFKGKVHEFEITNLGLERTSYGEVGEKLRVKYCIKEVQVSVRNSSFKQQTFALDEGELVRSEIIPR